MAAEGSHAGLTAAARQARNLAMLGKTLQRQREEKEERIAMASIIIIITCQNDPKCLDGWWFHNVSHIIFQLSTDLKLT